MVRLSLALVVLALGGPQSPRATVAVNVAFAPAAKGVPSGVLVHFVPSDPDVKVNADPAPRLALAAGQKILVDKQGPPSPQGPMMDPDEASYLDPLVPVRFPAVVAPKAPRGDHRVPATVTYFYCSKRDGWCKKGTAEVEVPVRVP